MSNDNPLTWDIPRDEDWFNAFVDAVGMDSGLTVPICPEGVSDFVEQFRRRVAELEREVRYLRAHGNKDCTAMAEAAMERKELESGEGE